MIYQTRYAVGTEVIFHDDGDDRFATITADGTANGGRCVMTDEPVYWILIIYGSLAGAEMCVGHGELSPAH